ncbi:MAG: Ig family protein [Ignavibacteria bacterium]|nr:Ig family protein [Ignavibacteria bacterium]
MEKLFSIILFEAAMKAIFTYLQKSIFFLILLILNSVLLLATEANNSIYPDLSGYEIKNGYVVIPEPPASSKPLDKPLATIKYIFFNNFDQNFADDGYYAYLTDQKFCPDFWNKSISVPFSDGTFDKYKITDFDVAIFPMGTLTISLQTTSGNHKLTQKILDMIDSGKKVLLVGENIAFFAFDSRSPINDSVAKDILANKFGIDYIKRCPVSTVDGNTTTWYGFFIRGHFGDIVGQSMLKFCNQGFISSEGTWWPLRTQPILSFDAFRTKDGSQFFPTENFLRVDGTSITDTLVGIRSEIGKSRLIFSSIGFESYAGDLPRGTLMNRCMSWLAGNIAPDGPVLNVDSPQLSFGSVMLKKSSENSITILNKGKGALKLYRAYLGSEKEFVITSGEIKKGGTVTLTTNQMHTINLKFTPTAITQYLGTLNLVSNDGGKDTTYTNIDLFGEGGEGGGPRLTTDFSGDTIDFGKLMPPNKNDINIILHNRGDNDLVISKIDFPKNDQDAFNFPQKMEYPIYLEPQKDYTLKTRFSSRTDYKDYWGIMRIYSNNKGKPETLITLKASVVESGVDDGTGVSADGLLLLTLSPNPTDNRAMLEYVNSAYIPKNLELFITDGNGIKVTKLSNGTVNPGKYQKEISVENLSSGVYFIVGKMDNSIAKLKFVVVK